jgi:hypothetical protein
VSPVKYELGFYIREGDILHSLRRENLKSYRSFNLREVCICFGMVCVLVDLVLKIFLTNVFLYGDDVHLAIHPSGTAEGSRGDTSSVICLPNLLGELHQKLAPSRQKCTGVLFCMKSHVASGTRNECLLGNSPLYLPGPSSSGRDERISDI